MTESAPLALLADGHNLIFRAFTSVPRSITSPDGRAVNGVYGLVGTLLRLIRDQRPDFLAVAFDVPEAQTYRHKLYPAYQGQRGPLGGAEAENFAWQVEQAKKVLSHIDIPWLVAEGFEADDIIGTLSVMGSSDGVRSLIVSNDRDLQQLVNDGVHVLIPGKSPLEVGPEQVQSRLGIPPSRIVDWKVLAGDPSDNIPGVAGIGDKSAVELVMRYGSWQSVYDHIEDVSSRQRSALEAGRQAAELFSEIVKVQCDLELGVAMNDLKVDISALPDRAGIALRLAGLREAE